MKIELQVPKHGITKAQEIELLGDLCEKLPDSYLRLTLRHIKTQFANDTSSDFLCLPDLAEINEAKKTAQELLDLCRKHKDDVEERRQELERQVAQLERRKAEFVSELEQLKIKIENVVKYL